MVRQEFLSEMEQKLRQFDEKLERLAARPRPKSEHARLEREKTYFYLQASRAELRERLKQTEYAPMESWREFTQSMRKIYENMARRMDSANGADEHEPTE
ncbi:MAG: hypothetical protein Q8O35_11525 [Humidesulfovibrio sp.]|jgi:uncharacterized membrane protein YccC|uniref:hypothetical protein n=1 Tax=Humidesulfovibrio sp. TaxID=2910988 RepID=UPI002734F008|nr:hypothetical protein [Humidesulfovibrio sp.]MDP2848803.1 hypothetical protein [Humidesulfovibrio sp.]